MQNGWALSKNAEHDTLLTLLTLPAHRVCMWIRCRVATWVENLVFSCNEAAMEQAAAAILPKGRSAPFYTDRG